MAGFIDVIADRIIGHTVNLLRYDARLRSEIVGLLLELQDELVARISAYDPSTSRVESVKMQRLRQLLADSGASINTVYRDVTEAHAEAMQTVAGVETEFAATSINAVAQADLVSASLAPRALAALTKADLIEGAPAAAWWKKQSTDLFHRYAAQIRLGYMQSEPIGTLLQRIRGRSTGRYVAVTTKAGNTKRVPQFVGGVMDTSTREAAALIRTSVQSIANAARHATYSDNGDMVLGVQALAVLDNRTSEICRARSGHCWDMEGKPIRGTTEDFPGPPPWHFNCRSTLIPILKSWEDLAGPNSKLSKRRIRKLERDMSKGTQSSMDGQVSVDLNYEAWLKTKPEDFQKEVLGKGKWELWKRGKLTLEDMVDQTGRPISLAELRARSR